MQLERFSPPTPRLARVWLGRGAVLARRRAGELQEDVVERRAAQTQIAHPNSAVAQRRGGLFDQLEAVPRRRKRELVQALAGLSIAAPYSREHRARLIALGGAHQLHF